MELVNVKMIAMKNIVTIKVEIIISIVLRMNINASIRIYVFPNDLGNFKVQVMIRII